MSHIHSIFFKTLSATLAVIISFAISSCSGDDDSPATKDISGSWSGTQAYTNPVSGTKYKYLTLTFNAGGKGDLTYESPVGYSYGIFSYTVINNQVKCTGVWATTDDDTVDTDFTMTLEIHGDRLIPIDRYSGFILTIDNSVITDDQGNELIDGSHLLPGVWISTDNSAILEFHDLNKYTLYQIDSDDRNSYSYSVSGEYSYDFLRNILIIGNSRNEVRTLNASELIMMNLDTYNLLSFKRGTSNDIPKGADIKDYLYNAALLWSSASSKETFKFNKNGNVVYWERSNVQVGSWGKACLTAQGTYSVNNKTIICNFTDVSWEGGNYSQYANIFSGWEYNKPCTKTYTVTKAADGILELITPDGYTIRLHPD